VNTLCNDRVLVTKESDNPEDAHTEEGINIKPVSVGKDTKYNLNVNVLYTDLCYCL
jgi:hypothetical protein